LVLAFSVALLAAPGVVAQETPLGATQNIGDANVLVTLTPATPLGLVVLMLNSRTVSGETPETAVTA
jgi:hypothetical protein